jgi:hypothetical protein
MAIDEEAPNKTGLPALAIALGLAQAIIGGVAALPLAWCCIFTVMQWYKLFRFPQIPAVLPRFEWYTLSVWSAMLLAICAFASGMWLLHRNPRGRRWTFVLACMGIVYGSSQISALFLLPSSGDTLAANPQIWYRHNGLLMTYCLIAIVIMNLPNVKRAYAKNRSKG